jgi:thioredoxin reductase (NADPH)
LQTGSFMADDMSKLIIIGSGPAGITAGIYGARSQLRPRIFEGKNPGGQLMGTTYVENWPGDTSILGPSLMMRMKEHALKLGVEFLQQEVVKVDFTQRPFRLWTHKEHEFKSHAVIIATGAIPKRLGCSGEDDYWGKGVSTCAVCDGAFYQDQEVVIVGGGDTAMEEASFMTKFTNKITLVQISDALTACASMQERVLTNNAITIIYNSTITAIQGDGSHVTSITIKNNKTNQETKQPTKAVFLAVGLQPSSGLFKDTLALDKHGYIQVGNASTQTSVPGVFAAGDVVDYRYRQAITSAGTGCMAALDAERYLSSL